MWVVIVCCLSAQEGGGLWVRFSGEEVGCYQLLSGIRLGCYIVGRVGGSIAGLASYHTHSLVGVTAWCSVTHAVYWVDGDGILVIVM